jgi:hypothetical protein
MQLFLKRGTQSYNGTDFLTKRAALQGKLFRHESIAPRPLLGQHFVIWDKAFVNAKIMCVFRIGLYGSILPTVFELGFVEGKVSPENVIQRFSNHPGILTWWRWTL